jgi:hypothetical protein
MNTAAVRGALLVVAALGVVFCILGVSLSYSDVQAAWGAAGIATGIIALLMGVVAAIHAGAHALKDKFARMPPRVQRRWRLVGYVAGVAALVWAIYDPPRDRPTGPFAALGASVAWGVHDLLGLAPHDWQTWEARHNKLEARLARERTKAPETIYALVQRGRDLESAKFLVAMRLRDLEREVAAAQDSVAAYRSSTWLE